MRVASDTSPHRSTIGIVLLTLFIDLVGFSIIFPLYPAMLEHYFGQADSGVLYSLLTTLGYESGQGLAEGNLTPVLFGGFLGSIYAILQFFSAPFWGSLSDRIGRRKVLLLTLSGTALSYLLWIFSGSFELLLASRLLGGLMAGNLSVATAAVADLTPKTERSRGMALVGVAFGLGFLFGPVLGGLGSLWNPTTEGSWLASIPGINPFSGAAIIAFSLSLFNFVWAWSKLPETHSEQQDTAPRSESPLSRLFSIFHVPTGPQRLIHLAYFVFMLSFSGMEFSLTFFAAERFDYSPSQMVWIFLWVGFLLLIAQGFLVRRFVKKVGEKRMTWIGITLTLIGFWGLSASSSETGFYLSLFLISIGFGVVSPCITALVSLYAHEQEQGSRIGTFRSAGSLARALGPFAVAFLYFRMGASISYLLASFLIVIALLLALRLPSPSLESSHHP